MFHASLRPLQLQATIDLGKCAPCSVSILSGSIAAYTILGSRAHSDLVCSSLNKLHVLFLK